MNKVILRIASSSDLAKWGKLIKLTQIGQIDQIIYITDKHEIQTMTAKVSVTPVEFAFDKARNIVLEFARNLYPDALFFFLDADEVLLERKFTQNRNLTHANFKLDIASIHTQVGRKPILDKSPVFRVISSLDKGNWYRGVHEQYRHTLSAYYLPQYYIEHFGYDVDEETIKAKATKYLALLEQEWEKFPSVHILNYMFGCYNILNDKKNAFVYLDYIRKLYPKEYEQIIKDLERKKND